MRASVEWLKELLPDLKASALAIEKRLTQAGHEVEGRTREADAVQGIIAAEVRGLKAHPNADGLRVAEVFDGEVERVVVCGAPNVGVGQKVAFAPVGCTLASGVVIAKRAIRGVESEGMICSEAELGLSDDAAGIMVLKPRSRPGTPLADLLGMKDVALEISSAPNRPDILSHLGVARELAALYGLALPRQKTRIKESREAASRRVRIEIDATDRCARYVGRVVLGVKVGPSPAWVRRRLKMVGLRSISNVVDATNLALMELGHPLHAFDLARVAGPRIVVRTAREGERLTTIDGVERNLSPDDLVIADAEGAVAIAGVMGGSVTGVGPETVDVLLESAMFDPASVRRTSKRHALHTEASHRFERGADPCSLDNAIDRCAALIVELAGGSILDRRIEVEKRAFVRRVVSIRPSRAERVIGRPVDGKEVRDALSRLGLEPVRGTARGKAKAKATAKTKHSKEQAQEALTFEVPSWRVDLLAEADLIGEVARLAGYDSIPTRMPALGGDVWSAPVPVDHERRVREFSAHLGFLETISLAFTSKDQAESLSLPLSRAVRVANPLGEESALLRMSLLPALLRAARLNQDLLPSVTDLRLFEVGTTFEWDQIPERLPHETPRVGLLLRGHRLPSRWASGQEMYDAYDMKAVVEALLGVFSIACDERTSWTPAERAWLHPRSATRIEVDSTTLGLFGELHPDTMRRYGLDGSPVFVAELDLAALVASQRGVQKFRALPKHPPARRDLSFFVDRTVPATDVLQVIHSSVGVSSLESADIFDVYEGRGLPDDKRSIAVAMTFRLADRTLTDAEVEADQLRIVESLSSRLGAQIRSA